MKFNKFLKTAFCLSTIILSSCSKEASQDKNILISPCGAPTLATYKLIIKGKAETLKDASQIPTVFSSGSKPFIVFDSSKGLNIIKKHGENAKYKYLKMLTGGNFHLLAFNKSAEEVKNLTIAPEDVIYGFQKNNTPDLLFKNIFKEAGGCDFYANAISDLVPKLLSMDANYKVDGNVLNYALVAEPASTTIINKLKNKHPNLLIQDINLQQAFKLKHPEWKFDYIPQAGLFVRNDIDLKQKIYKEALEGINSSINVALSDPSSVISLINNAYNEDATLISSVFGFQPNAIKMVQGNNGQKNGFGIVPNEVSITKEDIATFNSLLAK